MGTCFSCLVIGRKGFKRHFKHQKFFFSRRQFPCFSKSSQNLIRLSKFSLGRIYIDLHHFFARIISRVGYLYLYFDHIFYLAKLRLYGKIRIGKPESERITHFIPGPCLKITVAHINIFFIDILVQIPEIFIRRIILQFVGNRVSQLSRRAYLSGQYICRAVSPRHTPLPCVEHSLRLVPVHESHIHNVSHIEHHYHLFKVPAHLFQHILFRFRKQIGTRMV